MESASSEPTAAQLREKLAAATEENRRLETYVKLLKEELRLLRLDKFGPSAERLSDLQVALLELEPSLCLAEVETEAAQDEAIKSQQPKSPRRKPVRGPLPEHLPRVEIVIPCNAVQCQCGQCGGDKKLIGYESSERLSCKPVEFFVEVTKREKRACAKCEEMGVSVAPVPPTIIEKGILSDQLVVNVLLDKYVGHSPFYRQAMSIDRDTNVVLNQDTLSNSVLKAGELLAGICEAMRLDLLAGGYIQADETTVPVQSKNTKGKHHQAYLWEYGRPGGSVVMNFQMSREREGPAKFLAGYNGKLQCDGYTGYDKIGGEKITFFGCMAHARRKFFEASKVDPKDARCVALVSKIAELYAVEAQAREGQLDAAARATVRESVSAPLLAELKAMILKVRPEVLPESVFGKACSYALNQWERLERYAAPGNGDVEIDNNWAENGMRGIALGRKNWVQIGSEAAGPKVAAIISVLETCKRLKVNARDYLKDVLPKLSYWSTRPGVSPQPFAELTPSAWQSARCQTAAAE
jgi:transposase